jgi:UDP-glucose 4-epimerase
LRARFSQETFITTTSFMKGKKILITGGAGFIGSHLCELLSESNSVCSLDNYLTGSIDNHIDGVEYINGDCKKIQTLCSHIDPDVIYHLGEYSRVETSFDDYGFVIENNLSQFQYVLEFAKEKKAKLIYSGSSTKFGDDYGGSDASPYAWTKATNTKHLSNYSEWFGLEYAIVYFYNAYGGRELSQGKYATLIGRYQKLYKKGLRSLPVVRPGTQVRNFTHISDIISALVIVGEKGKGDGFGIGADESFSILEVVSMFGCDYEWLEERKGNRMTAELVTTKTKDLGWSPKTRLPEYIKKQKN